MNRPAGLAVCCLILSLFASGCNRTPTPNPEPAPAPTPNPTPNPRQILKPVPPPDPKPVIDPKPVPDPMPKTPTDREQMQGIWALIGWRYKGLGVPEDRIAYLKMMMVCEGDRYLYYRVNGVEQQGTLILDPTTTPKRLEKTPPLEGSKSPQKGIYEIKGNTLRLCLSDGPTFPSEFAAGEDGLTRILEFRFVAKLGDVNAPIVGTGTPMRVEDLALAMRDSQRIAALKGKVLIVEGTVVENSLKTEGGNSIILYKETGADGKKRSISCSFALNKREDAKALSVGERVRVSGECGDLFSGQLDLVGATILK